MMGESGCSANQYSIENKIASVLQKEKKQETNERIEKETVKKHAFFHSLFYIAYVSYEKCFIRRMGKLVMNTLKPHSAASCQK